MDGFDSSESGLLKAQLTEPQAKDVMRICCLWHAIQQAILRRLGEENLVVIKEQFEKGCWSQCCGTQGAPG